MVAIEQGHSVERQAYKHKFSADIVVEFNSAIQSLQALDLLFLDENFIHFKDLDSNLDKVMMLFFIGREHLIQMLNPLLVQ